MDPITIVLALAGLGAGYGASTVQAKRKLGTAEQQIEKELKKAKKESERQVAEAREEALRIAEEARREDKTRRNEFKDIETRLLAREESLDKKLDNLDKRSEGLRKGEDEVEKIGRAHV